MKLNRLTRWVFAISASLSLALAADSKAAIISAATGYWLGSYTGSVTTKSQILQKVNVLIDGFNEARITEEAPDLPFEYQYFPGDEIPDADLINAIYATNNMVPEQPVACNLTLDVTGYEYLHVRIHGSSYYYYVAGLTGENTFCNDLDYQQGNDSVPNTIDYYNLLSVNSQGVPEGGTSIVLLGLGIFGLGAARRFLAVKAKA
jgi:hypothetical protein